MLTIHHYKELCDEVYEENGQKSSWVDGVAQLLEHSLTTSEVCNLDPDIGKFYLKL